MSRSYIFLAVTGVLAIIFAVTGERTIFYVLGSLFILEALLFVYLDRRDRNRRRKS